MEELQQDRAKEVFACLRRFIAKVEEVVDQVNFGCSGFWFQLSDNTGA
jgi:hypothetical protein